MFSEETGKNILPKPVTKREKFEYYMWQHYPITENHHLKSAPFINKNFLIGYRLLIAVFYLAFCVAVQIINKPSLSELRYFTNWGVNITCISFCLLVYGHINEMISKKNDSASVYSPWMNEKWAIFFSELALTFEGVIVIFYWGFLFHGHETYT